jgi:toxin ParE1/3/4
MPGRRWTIRLTAAAEADVRAIFVWTVEHFGVEQARRYRATILAAFRDLDKGPDAEGVRDRAELGRGLKSLHVARHGRRGRHLILFTAGIENRIQILRILHDSMDLARHLPGERKED